MASWLPTEQNDVIRSRAGGRPRVLVVEDDPELSRLVTEALAGEFEVVTASDGQEGLAQALAAPVDLVVTDARMPGLGEAALVPELRRRPGTEATPILLLSASSEDALRGRLLREGVQDYVVKPFQAEELRARARNLVALHRVRDLLRREVDSPDSGPLNDLEALAREVTERQRELQQALDAERRAREALRRSEERLQAILDNAPAVIYLKDLEGRMLMVNRAFEELFGVTREAAIGRTDHELSPPELADAYRVNDLRVLRENAAIEQEETALLRGEPRTYRSLKFPLRDGSGAPYATCGVSTDITEQKRAEDERHRVEEFQDRLIGIVSHDIRSPVTALQTSARQVLRKPGLDDRLRPPLERIVRCGERIEQLIRVLVDFTRARLGEGLPITPRSADFHDACRRGVAAARAAHPEARVHFDAEGEGAGTWDPDRLAQVATSLVDNALRYGAPGGEVRVRTRGQADEVMLEVHNRGEPIPADQFQRLFEPFERGRREESTVTWSLGLGLFLVRAIARAHHGSVEVESRVEAGTTFRLRLPRIVPAPPVGPPDFT